MATEKEQMKISRLLIELDCLFDIRMAILLKMGDDEASAAFKHGYYDRISDYFPGVDYEKFKELYAARDKSILQNAILTPLGGLLREFALETLKNINNSPFHMKPAIVINTYPYKLNNDEANIIIEGVKMLTNGACDIECVNLSPLELTPLYLKLNLSMLALYEYDQWLEVQALNGGWKKYTAPDVTLLAPRISMKKLEHATRDLEQGFKEMEQNAAPFVNLKLINVDNFSIALRPEHFKEFNKQTANNT